MRFSKMLQKQCFAVQMDNDSKLTAIATQEFLKGKKLYILQWPTVLNPVEHVFQFLTKLNTRRPTNKQQSLTSSNPFRPSLYI